MAVCKFCDQEMTVADGCTLETFSDFADGVARPRIRFGEEFRDHAPSGSCHDCGAKPGSLHHPGCDMEVCPRCGGQAIGCECLVNADPVAPWRPADWPWFCDDCGTDGSGLGENYMVKDEIWPRGATILCIACLERRLGRELSPDDFDLRGTWHEQPLSPRLRKRLRR